MSCKPDPEALCGNTYPDTCITISDANLFKSCPAFIKQYLPDPDGCYRQADFNKYFANYVCSIAGVIGQFPTCAPNPVAGSGILGSIGLGCLVPCNPDLDAPFKPVSTGNQNATVSAEIQNVYVALCDLKTTLNGWTDLPLPQDFDLGCIGDKCCGPAPTTLGTLLQAMVNKICCITKNAVDSSGIVLDDKVSGACPNC